jgi:oligosaccharide repeat unit polymerase
MHNVVLILFFIGIFGYIFSVFHYKSFFNPLGLYSIIWGTIPFLYDLRLSTILMDLSLETYYMLIVSFISFIFACILLTKTKYKKYENIKNELPRWIYKKSIKAYYFFLFLCIIEMFIKTPTLLTKNPFGTYSQGVTGVRFLHFALVMIQVCCFIILYNPNIKKWKKFLYGLPPFLVPALWGQRGMMLSFIIGAIFICTISIKLRKQLVFLVISSIIILQIIVFIGTIRTNYIDFNKTAKINNDSSKILVWAYMYTTPSVQNLNQTIENKDVQFVYGYGLIEPIFSLLQLKFITNTIKDLRGNDRFYKVISGFNVPTYLYWCYINFGFSGFFIIPFVLGLLLQSIYNKMNSGNWRYIFLYAIFMPCLIYSFHDFLFWDGPIIMMIFTLILITRNIKEYKYFKLYCKYW